MKIEATLRNKLKAIPAIDPFSSASDTMFRMVMEDLSEMPVIYSHRFLGLADRRILFDKLTTNEEFGDSLLAGLKENVVVAAPGDEIEAILRQLSEGQLIVPILKGGRFLRAIHREDLMKELLHEKEDSLNQLKNYITSFGIS